MTNTSLQIGDVYALQEKETGKWFAFQIVQIGEENAVYIDLDYWSEMIPEENDLNKMSFFLTATLQHCNTSVHELPERPTAHSPGHCPGCAEGSYFAL